MYFNSGPLFVYEEYNNIVILFILQFLRTDLIINFFPRVFIKNDKGKDKPTSEAKRHNETESFVLHVGLFALNDV